MAPWGGGGLGHERVGFLVVEGEGGDGVVWCIPDFVFILTFYLFCF
jgi:hypothetical protein